MDKWKTLADKATIEEIIQNLIPRGINAYFVENSKEAKKKAIELMPDGSRVLASASITLEKIGIKEEIENSQNLVSVRKEYMALDHQKDGEKIRVLRSTPDIILGSVHAVTKKGEILIASNTGSQLAGYVYSAKTVIWIVGVQKIVENLDEGMKRIYEYIVPLENKHMQSLYGVNTNVSKILIFDKEIAKDRVNLIFVNEALGF